jgi:serine protease
LANGQQVVRQQLSRAGVRLAMVLNRALAAGGSTGGGTTGGTGHVELLGNPGFENGSQATPWTATAGVISDSPSEQAHGGHWTAWLDGYGTRTTDTLYQTVALPGSNPATLSFWLHIDTDETTTTQVKDSLKVQVLSTTGKILATLATYSNLDAAPGYAQKSFELGAYQGQRIKIRFTGSEDGSKQTSFVIDDASIQ